MQSLPVLDAPFGSTRVIPFDPFADLAAMARKRNIILTQLAQERSKSRPDEWLVKAYEIWLRVYSRNAVTRNV